MALGAIRIPKGLKCLCRLLPMHILVSRHLQDFLASIQVSESIFSLCTMCLIADLIFMHIHKYFQVDRVSGDIRRQGA